MKTQWLVFTGILLVALLPRYECRPQLEEEEEEAASAKEKRAGEPMTSLDLTFHLLRELLEIARAEQMAKQAQSNRELMETIGK